MGRVNISSTIKDKNQARGLGNYDTVHGMAKSSLIGKGGTLWASEGTFMIVENQAGEIKQRVDHAIVNKYNETRFFTL